MAIVGASLAGAKAAEAARDAGYDGRIVLVGDEPLLPYERPALSKEILRGEMDVAEARVHPDAFYDDNDIELVFEPVTTLDLLRRRIELASGRATSFDTAVIATGAAPRRLAVSGADLPGVFHLRTLADAQHLRDVLRASGRVVIVGAGWIGSEVAASARQMGVPATVVDPAPTPLHGVLGERLGQVDLGWHADHGVKFRPGRHVTAVRGTTQVEGVTLDDGTTEAGDIVVVGIGVSPRTELARAAVGMRVDNGIVVDAHLESSVEGVYAAGDVANAWHPHYQQHVRSEHWANALNQGATAGRNAAGAREIYDRLPYFFSDQYDLGLEYVGHHDRDDSLVVRGDLRQREFVTFWQRDGEVTAAMAVNVWNAVDDLKRIIQRRITVPPALLADLDIPLRQLSESPLGVTR
jgi:3-phenylpropionate/trans-cinnamate dioxygenase ferredoxin reductase subunit